MPAPSQVTTVEHVRALPEDGLRHELLDGVHVVTPSPARRHQAVLREFMFGLEAALRDVRHLELLSSPSDVELGPRTLVQPDLFVFRRKALAPTVAWSDVGIPVLAIEILSPGTAHQDRGVKRRVYQRARVAEYWIVDLDARVVERWRPEDGRPEVLDGSLLWECEGVGVTLDLPAMFARVLGPPEEGVER